MQDQADDSPYLSPADLVARVRGVISEKSWAVLRSQGRGPDYVTPLGKILYLRESVDEWLRSHPPQKARRGAGRPRKNSGKK